ncbi:MAG: nucleotidyltransferase family protein [Thermodesulfobacteriota bacterium]
MLDADILVPTRRAREAVELLTGLGWSSSITPLKDSPDMDALSRLVEARGQEVSEYSDEYFTVRHGQDLVNRDEFTIDLHWHVLHGYNPPDADAPFWEAARRVTVEGAPVLVLDPVDQLLQVCAHGMRWDPTPPVRWVADAAVILRKEGEGSTGGGSSRRRGGTASCCLCGKRCATSRPIRAWGFRRKRSVSWMRSGQGRKVRVRC